MAGPSQFFRAGVGIMVTHGDHEVLALRRADVSPDAWQMPQGGIGPGEEPEAAMWRELREETGLTEASCELVAVSEGWLAYELPEAHRSAKLGRGQVQRWYLCRFSGRDSDIVPDGKEFDRWKWVGVDRLLADVTLFRRPIYESLVAQFSDHLS